MRNISVRPGGILLFPPGRDAARAPACSLLRRCAGCEKTKVWGTGVALSPRIDSGCESGAFVVALSSSLSFRSSRRANLRGDVMYSAEFTRVCKQAARKRERETCGRGRERKHPKKGEEEKERQRGTVRNKKKCQAPRQG